MMFNFDEIIDRRGTNSMKWDQGAKRLTPEQYKADPLPMWVADMDFRIAPSISQALHGMVDMGVLGYGGTTAACAEAVIDWHARRFGWKPQPEWLTQASGVVHAMSMTIQAFSQPGDHVVVQTPVYAHFLNDAVVNGRRVIQAPLRLEGDKYRFDPESFEAALLPGTKIFILCNPHNPTGNVWTKDELLLMADICERHDILIVSDEVHEDFVMSEHKRHIPFASLDHAWAARSVVCNAPSKTFNLAGLACANVFISDPHLRRDYRAQCEKSGVTLINTMGIAACQAAYSSGEPWVEAMLSYVRANHEHLRSRAADLGLPFKVMQMDALYLAWLDFRELGMTSPELHDFLLRRARLWLDPGQKFGPAGQGFARINLACPRSTVDEALARVKAAFR